MSFETYNENDENGQKPNSQGNPNPSASNSNPYGYGAPQAQNNPNPYGNFPAAPPHAANPNQPQGNPHPGQNFNAPYAFDQQNTPYQGQTPQAPKVGGFTIFGLGWQKNVIPNPATGGVVPREQKSVVVAYLLWFFLGFLGLHQFYLGNTKRGLLNLTLWAVTTIISFIGIPFALVYTAYWIYEAVTLNTQTLEVNNGYIRHSIL